MEHLIFGNAHDKVVSIVVICAERFGEKRGKFLMIPFPLTHKVIANLVGLSRETASLEVKKLERAGLITHKGRLMVIKDLKKLKNESSYFS